MRTARAVLCALALFLVGAAEAAASHPGWKGETYGGFAVTEQSIEMADGKEIAVRVLMPTRNSARVAGAYPVLLSVNPYGGGSNGSPSLDDWFPRHGVIRVVADVRGTGDSEGSFDEIFSEDERDDTLALIQHFSSPEKARWTFSSAQGPPRVVTVTGKVALFGQSYGAIAALLAAAEQPEHLVAVYALNGSSDVYREAVFHGGIFSQLFGWSWLAYQQSLSNAPAVRNCHALTGGSTDPNTNSTRLTNCSGEVSRHGARLAERAQSTDGSVINSVLSRPTFDDWWAARAPAELADQIKIPVLLAGGWLDGFSRGPVELWDRLSRREGVETLLRMAPWPHSGSSETVLLGQSSGKYDCDVETATRDCWVDHRNPFGYGPAGARPVADDMEFLDRHLLGVEDTATEPVHAYVMGGETYDEAAVYKGAAWPPADAEEERFHLGLASSLTKRAPGAGEEGYVTNPADGWSTTASRHLNVASLTYAPLDQNTERNGGLVWETDPLDKPLTLAGPLALHLVAKSTAPDTDWFVRVSDVRDGEARLITEGHLRASHRALDETQSTDTRPYHTHANPQSIPPGEELTYDIEIWQTAYRLEAGHRLRIQLTSNDSPNHFPGDIRMLNGLLVPTPHEPAVNTVLYGKGKSALRFTALAND